jgi:hypothetical protein
MMTELERTWKEVPVVKFEALSGHLIGEPDRNHKKNIHPLRFKHFQILARSVTASVNFSLPNI